MTQTEQEKIFHAAMLNCIPEMKDSLLNASLTYDEKNIKLYWLKKCGLLTVCTLKNVLTGEETLGEAFQYHDATVFIPIRCPYTGFRIGDKIIDFRSSEPFELKSI
jgi:hypothetical protein